MRNVKCEWRRGDDVNNDHDDNKGKDDEFDDNIADNKLVKKMMTTVMSPPPRHTDTPCHLLTWSAPPLSFKLRFKINEKWNRFECFDFFRFLAHHLKNVQVRFSAESKIDCNVNCPAYQEHECQEHLCLNCAKTL